MAQRHAYFSASGIWTAPPGVVAVDVLVTAGGGGGGDDEIIGGTTIRGGDFRRAVGVARRCSVENRAGDSWHGVHQSPWGLAGRDQPPKATPTAATAATRCSVRWSKPSAAAAVAVEMAPARVSPHPMGWPTMGGSLAGEWVGTSYSAGSVRRGLAEARVGAVVAAAVLGDDPTLCGLHCGLGGGGTGDEGTSSLLATLNRETCVRAGRGTVRAGARVGVG